MTRIRVLEVVGNGEGGGTKCLARLVCHLDPARFAITVIAPEAPWLAKVCAQFGADYHPLPLLSSRVDAKLTAELAQIARDVQPDIVNGHGTRAAWFALRSLTKQTPRPALVYSEHLFSFDARTGARRLPWMAIERHICRHADALATSCGANAQLAESHGWVRPEQIAMRHYGIELDVYNEQAKQAVTRQELDIAPDALLIGTVGRLVPQKGMRYWLDAAAQVVRAVPEAQFLIIGDGELRTALERHAYQMGLSQCIRFLGAQDKPWRILAACDFIAFSSLFEGLPQTGIEALAAGMPIVATRMNGTEEIIRDGWNGLLVPTRDARKLADAMVRLARDPVLRAQMRVVGPDSVAEYRTEIMIQHFHNTYVRLYNERQSAKHTPLAQAAVPVAHE